MDIREKLKNLPAKIKKIPSKIRHLPASIRDGIIGYREIERVLNNSAFGGPCFK